MGQKLCTNVCVTGEPGIGKSYEAIDILRTFEGLYHRKPDGKLVGRFKPEQIVFTHSDYMDLLIKLRLGKGICFDEPSYAMGKRDWFKDLQKVLVHTLESQRFLVHPLFIPIINMSLLDKTIRNYLIQFRIHVLGRGRAWVYRLKPSQTSEKVYHDFMCELIYRQYDSHLCNLPSCLGCKELEECQIFRAQYERKKKSTQYDRYEQAREDARKKESKDLTEDQLAAMLMPYLEELRSERNERLSVGKMRSKLRRFDPPVIITKWKARQIKENIEHDHPGLFEEKGE